MIFNLLGAVQRPKLSQHSADFHFNSIPSHQAEKCEQGQSLFEGSLKMDEYQEKLREGHPSATEATRYSLNTTHNLNSCPLTSCASDLPKYEKSEMWAPTS